MSRTCRHAYFVGWFSRALPQVISQRAYDRWFYVRSAPLRAAGRVRFATFVLELRERRPVAIVCENYYVVEADGDGHLDRAAWAEHQRSAIDMLEDFRRVATDSAGVIDAAARFAIAKYRWTPTTVQRKSLLAAWKLPLSW